MTRTATIVLLAFALLSGCSDPSSEIAEPPVNTARSATATPSRAPGTAPTEITGSSSIALFAITYDEFSPLIDSGLGCSFRTADGELVFVATAPDQRTATAAAVIDSGSGARVIEAESAGGYRALVEGGRFSDGSGISVGIERDSCDGHPSGIETTSWSASLMLRGEDGETRIYDNGTYDCGA